MATIEIKGGQAKEFAGYLHPIHREIGEEVRIVRLTVDPRHGVSVKVNEGGWSPSYAGHVDLPLVDEWEYDADRAEAYVMGMADALEPTANDLPSQFHVAELREWAKSFGLFYAGRPQDISGMEGEKTLAEWFRYWRYVEESSSCDDADYPDAAPGDGVGCARCRAEYGDACVCEPTENEE